MLNGPQLGSFPHRLQGLFGRFRVLKRFNSLGGVSYPRASQWGNIWGWRRLPGSPGASLRVTRCFPQTGGGFKPWGGGDSSAGRAHPAPVLTLYFPFKRC